MVVGLVEGGCVGVGGLGGAWSSLGEGRSSLKTDWPIYQRQADGGNHNCSALPRPVANAAADIASVGVMGC